MNGIKRVFQLVVFIFITAGFLSGCGTKNVIPNTRMPEITTPSINRPENLKVSKFILGPGDEVGITVWRHEDMNQWLRINPSGYISYPLAGDIKAAGMSITELRDRIRESLLEYFVNPQIGMKVVSSRGQKVFVLGEVNQPGVFRIDISMDVIEAISLAGGFTLGAKWETILIIRGDLNNPNLQLLDLKKMFKEADLSQNIALQSGDILYVPASTIANVDRFFNYISNMITPIVTLEQGVVLAPLVKDVLD